MSSMQKVGMVEANIPPIAVVDCDMGGRTCMYVSPRCPVVVLIPNIRSVDLSPKPKRPPNVTTV